MRLNEKARKRLRSFEFTEEELSQLATIAHGHFLRGKARLRVKVRVDINGRARHPAYFYDEGVSGISGWWKWVEVDRDDLEATPEDSATRVEATDGFGGVSTWQTGGLWFNSRDIEPAGVSGYIVTRAEVHGWWERTERAEARRDEYEEALKLVAGAMGVPFDWESQGASYLGLRVAKIHRRVAELEAEKRKAFADGASGYAAMHPDGHCGCDGEGRCQWCQLIQARERVEWLEKRMAQIKEMLG